MSKEGQYVYEVARHFDMKTAEFKAAVKAHGFDWDVAHHMRRLSDDQVRQFAAAQGGAEAPVDDAEVEQAATPEAVDAAIDEVKQAAVESAEAIIEAEPIPAGPSAEQIEAAERSAGKAEDAARKARDQAQEAKRMASEALEAIQAAVEAGKRRRKKAVRKAEDAVEACREAARKASKRAEKALSLATKARERAQAFVDAAKAMTGR